MTSDGEHGERIGMFWRVGAVLLAFGNLSLIQIRLLGAVQSDPSVASVFELGFSIYFGVVMAYAGLVGRRPPKWLLPIPRAATKRINVAAWTTSFATFGFLISVFGLLIWTGEIRAGASEPPSLVENLAIALFFGGLFMCMPLLFAASIAALESAIPDVSSNKAMTNSRERESEVRPDQEGGGGFGGVASDRYSRVVQGALIYPIMHRRTLVRALLLPGAILIGLDYFLVGVTTEGEPPGVWTVVSYSIAVVVMSTLVAVAVHRTILRRAVDPTVLPKWTRNESKFLFYSFALFLMCLPFLGLMFIPIIGPILGAVGLIVMLVRFSLVLPAAAIDEPLSFGEAWSKSRGHTFFMLFSVAMFPVALSLPIKALENFQYGVYIIPLVSIVTTILTVAALSVAYRIVVEEGGAATDNAMRQPREIPPSC